EVLQEQHETPVQAIAVDPSRLTETAAAIDELRDLHEAALDRESRDKRDDDGREREAHPARSRARHQEHALAVPYSRLDQLPSLPLGHAAVEQSDVFGLEDNASGVDRWLVLVIVVSELFGVEEQVPDRTQKQLVLDEEDDLLPLRELLQGGEDLLRSLTKQRVTSLLADRCTHGSGHPVRLWP